MGRRHEEESDKINTYFQKTENILPPKSEEKYIRQLDSIFLLNWQFFKRNNPNIGCASSVSKVVIREWDLGV